MVMGCDSPDGHMRMTALITARNTLNDPRANEMLNHSGCEENIFELAEQSRIAEGIGLFKINSHSTKTG